MLVPRFQMLNRAGLLVAALTVLLPNSAMSQHDPIQVIVSVSEMSMSPPADGESGMAAVNEHGEVIVLPFVQRHSQPIRAEFSVVPEVLHKQRIIAGDADLYLELKLAAPKDNSSTAWAKFIFHKRRETTVVQEGSSLYQITDPFTNAATLEIPFTGSSVELGKRMERFGEDPNQTVVTTFVSLTVLPLAAGL